MAIVASAKSGNNFKPAPAGTHAAVCCDVIDLGILEVTYSGKTKKQHKVNIVWQIEELRDDNKPFLVRKRYTLSLHEKSAMRKDLESWRGKSFTNPELEGFDLEVLLGVGCLLNIIHAPHAGGGEPYANVAAIMKLPRNMPAPKVVDYIRDCERPKQDATSAPDEVPPPDVDTSDMGITDDDIPF